MMTANVYTVQFTTTEPLDHEVQAILAESLADTVHDVLNATADDLAVAVDQEVK